MAGSRMTGRCSVEAGTDLNTGTLEGLGPTVVNAVIAGGSLFFMGFIIDKFFDNLDLLITLALGKTFILLRVCSKDSGNLGVGKTEDAGGASDEHTSSAAGTVIGGGRITTCTGVGDCGSSEAIEDGGD